MVQEGLSRFMVLTTNLATMLSVGWFPSALGWVRGGGDSEGARDADARREFIRYGRAREKREAHWPVTRSCPVLRKRERPVTG